MTAHSGSLRGLDLRAEIDRLRKERNAVILAHYYQTPDIQDLADFVGDSLDLSRKAQATDAEVIAFCGVRFMAETAKILSPDKIVVLPDMNAGCSLEDSCPPDQFKAFREAHPDHIALTYINSSAEVKALSDIIVTSSSAETILKQIPLEQKIIFGPDKHLGGYLARKTGRDMLLWPGVCIVHEAFSETELHQAQGAASRRAGARPSRMPAAHHRPCRLCRRDLGHPQICARDRRRRRDDRRHRAAHHPPDGEGGAGQDLHRRARRGRQLQLQHVPVHGAQHDGEALRRAARPPAAHRDRGGAAPRAPRSRSTGCWKWPADTVGKGDVGRPQISAATNPVMPRSSRIDPPSLVTFTDDGAQSSFAARHGRGRGRSGEVVMGEAVRSCAAALARSISASARSRK